MRGNSESLSLNYHKQLGSEQTVVMRKTQIFAFLISYILKFITAFSLKSFNNLGLFERFSSFFLFLHRHSNAVAKRRACFWLLEMSGGVNKLTFFHQLSPRGKRTLGVTWPLRSAQQHYRQGALVLCFSFEYYKKIKRLFHMNTFLCLVFGKTDNTRFVLICTISLYIGGLKA